MLLYTLIMEILYVWIGDHYKSIKNLGFNFSKEYQFHFNPDSQKLNVIRKEDKITPLISEGKIKNITAIIGENGSGKTNVLEFLSKWIGNLNIPQIIICDFGIAYSESFIKFEYLGNEEYALKTYPIKASINSNEVNVFYSKFHYLNVAEKKQEVIYYNPLFDTRHTWRHGDYCRDISTNFLLNAPDFNRTRPGNGEVLNYRYNEVKKHLAFINSPLYKKLPPSFKYSPHFITNIAIRPNDIEFYRIVEDTHLIKIYNQLIRNCNKYSIEIYNTNKGTTVDGVELTKEIIAFNAVYTYLNDLHNERRILKDEIVKLCNLFILDPGSRIIDILKEKVLNFPALNHNNQDLNKGIHDFINFMDKELNLENTELKLFKPSTNPYDPFLFLPTFVHSIELSSFIMFEFMTEYDKTVFRKQYMDFFPKYTISSGEGGFITLYSRLYDIKNTVLPDTTLTIMIDEGESGYHPQWQKM